MSEQKFTPGPWRAVGLQADGQPHHILAGVWSDCSVLATDDNLNGLVAFADRPANARLIAASPTMFDALQWILELCGTENPKEFHHTLHVDIAEAARDAIAKATGESTNA